MQKRKTILIGADLVPSASNEADFIAGDATALVGEELKEIFDRAALRIANLEVALSRRGAPIAKAGPNFCVSPDTVNGYRALGIDLLTLANNHTMDYGQDAFMDTLATLSAAGIASVGGGKDQKSAAQPYVTEIDGKRIGVYACCEHEFSWAEDYGCGANGFDPLESLDEIATLRARVDYLIVLYHGGREQYRYPSPYLRKVCRKIADKGADLVLCQHTHCVGAKEEYRGSTLVYGQGNLLFDFIDNEYWNNGILVSVDVADGFRISYIPYEKQGKGIRLSEDPSILDGFFARSEEIRHEGFVEEHFHAYALSQLVPYYYNNIFKDYVDPALISGEMRKTVQNCLQCEVHREILIETLKADRLESALLCTPNEDPSIKKLLP